MNQKDANDWQHFPIQSIVELDFVIGQQMGWPVGTTREAPLDLKRRLAAAMISYHGRLKSIDYTLKNYVEPDQYDDEENLGDIISDHIRDRLDLLKEILADLHTQGELPFGTFGAEMTLFRVPSALNAGRMLGNRGLILEVIPILRSCLEMIAWAVTAFSNEDPTYVRNLRATNCIRYLKEIYPSAGQIYGFFSHFAHWDFSVHRHFIVANEGGSAILNASSKHRCLSLSYCLLILEILSAVPGRLYLDRQAELERLSEARLETEKRTKSYLRKIVAESDDRDLAQISKWIA